MGRLRCLATACFAVALFVVPASALGATVTKNSANGVIAHAQANGSLKFGVPPVAPPASFGPSALRLTTGPAGWEPSVGADRGSLERIFVPGVNGKDLADVDRLKYRVLREATSNNNLNVALKIEIDMTPGDSPQASGYATLVYEPIYNVATQAQQTGAWQTWDAYDGGDATWWATRQVGSFPSTTYHSFDDFVAADPDAKILSVHLAVGENATTSSWSDFIGWVDGLEVGIGDEPAASYDFHDDGSSTVPVAADGSELFTQVSNAVRSASAGDTVDVAAGTYVDQVKIDKDLTLTGDDVGGTTIQSPALLEGFMQNTTNRKPVVAVLAGGSGATVEDLVIDGAGKGNANHSFVGLGVINASADIDDVRVSHIRETPLNGVQHGLAIWADNNLAGRRTVSITDSVVDDYQKGGIVVNGGIDTDIRRNQITGIGPSSIIAGNGIQVSRGAAGDIVDNDVRANDYQPTSWSSSGILLYESGAVNVTGNVVRGNDLAIAASAATGTAGPVEAHFNDLAGNEYGITADNATVNGEHNWWGCNEGPNTADCPQSDHGGTGGLVVAPRLVLATSGPAGEIEIGGTTAQVTARLESSDGGQPAGLSAYPGGTIGFAGVLGTVAPTSADFEGADSVSTTFTAGVTDGDAKVVASLDDEDAEQALGLSDDDRVLVDKTDTTADGASCGAPANPCDTIAKGVAVANTGDTVDVAAGTYVEQVTVDKDVTVHGAGASTIVESPTTLTPITHNGSRHSIIGVSPQGDGATIENLLVDGKGRGAANNQFHGIGAWDASVTIDDVRVTGIRHDPLNGVQNGRAIWADAQAADEQVVISDSEIDDYQKSGIYLNGKIDADITGNTIAGGGPTDQIAQNGVTLLGGATGEMTGNTITGHAYTGAADAESAGVLLFQSGAATVSGNTLTGNDRGVSAFETTAPATVTANRIVGNETGAAAEGGAVVTAQNNWWGCNEGPAGADCDPVVEDGGTVNATPWRVLSLTAPARAATGTDVELVASLKGNSAGGSPATAMPGGTATFDSALGTVDPTTDDISGSQDATSTLSVGATAGDAAPSVQFDNETVTRALRVSDGIVRVDDSDATSDAGACGMASNPCNTVTLGIANAVAGETVDVAAGVYDERPTVDKAITVAGPQDGVQASTRDDVVTSDEAVLNGLNVTAKATIDGLYLLRPVPPTGGDVLMSVSAGTGQTIRNTVFRGGRMGLDLSTSGDDGSVVERNRFTDNRTGDGNGAHGIWIHPSTGASDLTIRDNAFSGHDHAGGNSSAINVGGIDGLTIEDNSSDTSDTLLVLTDSAGVVVEGNRARDLAGSGIFLGQGNDGVTVANNDIADGPGDSAAIRLSDAFGGDPVGGDPSTGYVITGNTLADYGYGVRGSGDAVGDVPEVHFNRIVDVDVTGVANDDAAHVYDAENNWFGCNAGQGGGDGCTSAPAADKDDVDATPHLQLSLTAAPTNIASGGATSALTASLRGNSAGQTPAGNAFPDGTLIGFAADDGTVDDDEVPTTDALAGTTYRSGGAASTDVPEASLDGQTVTASVRVGDLDGDGIADASDCSPGDAGKPLQGQTDANCDGVADPGPTPPIQQPQPPAPQPPVQNQEQSISFGPLLTSALGANPVADRNFAGLRRIGVFTFRPRGGYRIASNGRATLLGFGCQVACRITPTVKLQITPKRKGAKVQTVSVRAGRLSLAQGKTGVLRVTVRKSLRDRIKRAKRVRVQIAVKATSGLGTRSEDARYAIRLAR